MDSFYFEFEEGIRQLDEQIAKLEKLGEKDLDTGTLGRSDKSILTLRQQREIQLRDLYQSLSPWQTTLVSRHKDRPQALDLIHSISDEFVELHGDRRFGDDKAIVTGFGKIDQHKVMFVGHRKGRNAKERAAFNFGSAHPEGYRKALLRMKLAEKFGLPMVCLIDTAGAFPGMECEERGQHQAIAENLFVMSQLRVPIICVVIGEGGSGGALGIGLGNHVSMFQHAYYSVISPEGCAGILWKDKAFAEQAAKSLKLTSRDLQQLGAIEDIIPEPVGGAHRDPTLMATRLKFHLKRQLAEWKDCDPQALVDQRYERFRQLGEYLTAPAMPQTAIDGQIPTPDLLSI